jgi:hypothetical protein
MGEGASGMGVGAIRCVIVAGDGIPWLGRQVGNRQPCSALVSARGV